jgi:hypothetical protein
LATWLGLERLVIGRRGALATELRAQLPDARRARRRGGGAESSSMAGAGRTPVPIAEREDVSAESAH